MLEYQFANTFLPHFAELPTFLRGALAMQTTLQELAELPRHGNPRKVDGNIDRPPIIPVGKTDLMRSVDAESHQIAAKENSRQSFETFIAGSACQQLHDSRHHAGHAGISLRRELNPYPATGRHLFAV